MKPIMLCALIVCSVFVSGQTSLELAGYKTSLNPGFLIQRSFNIGDPIFVSVDPNQYVVDGLTARIYITENRNEDEWLSDPWLTDLRPSGFEVVTFTGDNLFDIAVELSEITTLDLFTGNRPGHAFDLVIDMDQDGVLGGQDYIDGWEDDRAGFYLVPNLNEVGPHDVDTAFYSSAEFRTFKLFFPSDIQDMVEQPLVVISHGWTHEYWYYDFLGEYLASYGYVVMSHRNDVGNGNGAASESASICALENIHELLANESTVANGMLNHKINNHLIIHTGHSTGGECVVRAYKRLHDNLFTSEYFDESDIVLVSSIAPVAFLDDILSNPMMANYHVFCGGADVDAEGAPTDTYKQTLSLYERARGNKQVTYIHGAGHEDFHGFNSENELVAGPDLIGKDAVHTVVKPYFLALCELYARNNMCMKDYFVRNKAEFRPQGIADEIIVSGEYQEATSENLLMIDDFQSNESTNLASSNASVSNDLDEFNEVLMRDLDGSFEWDGTQWSNGFCRARFEDDPKCAVVQWNMENRSWKYEMNGNISYWSEYDYLQFRSCQMTRHPNNLSLDGDIYFSVKVKDANGNEAVLSTELSGPIRKVYPKSNGGYGALCLPEGEYTVNAGGSAFNSEITFEVPGYVSGGSGSYSFNVGPGDPCSLVEFFMYDGFGDGWDNGSLQVLDSNGNLMSEIFMYAGSAPEVEGGWQNEFWNVRIRLKDFILQNPSIDLGQIVEFSLLFGPDHGSPLGALGIDDIHLLKEGFAYYAAVPNLWTKKNTLEIYPNPNDGEFFVKGMNLRKDEHVLIFDSFGKLIYQGNETVNGSMDLELNDGFYRLVLISQNVSYSTSFIVVK